MMNLIVNQMVHAIAPLAAARVVEDIEEINDIDGERMKFGGGLIPSRWYFIAHVVSFTGRPRPLVMGFRTSTFASEL